MADRPTSADRDDSVARGSAPLLWAQVLGNAGLFAAIVPVTRELGPTGRGTLAFITVSAIVCATLARFGVTEATTVRCAQVPRLRPVLLSNLLAWVTAATIGTAALVVGLLVLVAGLRPPGLGAPERAVLAAAIVVSGLVDAGYMFVLGCSRFRLHAAVTVATAWSYAATIAVASLVAELTVVEVGLCWVAFQLVKATLLLSACVRAEGLGRISLPLLRASLAFGSRAWVGTLSTAFNERVDQILVALIASEATLGIYAAAVNGFEILLYPAASAATAILPLAARAYPGERAGHVLGAFRSVALLTLAGGGGGRWWRSCAARRCSRSCSARRSGTRRSRSGGSCRARWASWRSRSSPMRWWRRRRPGARRRGRWSHSRSASPSTSCSSHASERP